MLDLIRTTCFVGVGDTNYQIKTINQPINQSIDRSVNTDPAMPVPGAKGVVE